MILIGERLNSRVHRQARCYRHHQPKKRRSMKIYTSFTLTQDVENVKKRSQKRLRKILQLERKTAIKRRFLPLRDVVFRYFRGQSIAFMLSKQPFYTLKAMLLSSDSYAFTS